MPWQVGARIEVPVFVLEETVTFTNAIAGAFLILLLWRAAATVIALLIEFQRRSGTLS